MIATMAPNKNCLNFLKNKLIYLFNYLIYYYKKETDDHWPWGVVETYTNTHIASFI
jgi:hypothetical protein